MRANLLQKNKKINISNEKILGSFYPYGGIIEINDFSYDFYKDSLNYFYEDPILRIPRQSKERKDICDYKINEHVKCLKTWTHEVHHLFLFFSSPLCLLIHFLLLMRTSYMQQMYLSLSKQYPNFESKDPEFIFLIKRLTGDINFLKRCLFGDGYYKINDTIEKFNGFMPLLNEFYRNCFSNIEEFDKISTNLPKTAFSSPSKMITPLKLLEGHSSITQKLILCKVEFTSRISNLLKLKANFSVILNNNVFEEMTNITDIFLENKGYIYSDAFKYYSDKLSININNIEYYHYTTFLLLVELSFKTPFEPNYLSVFKSNIWEDLHPSYRFYRLLSVINKVGFYKKATDYRKYSDKLCDLLNWPRLSLINQASKTIKYIPGTNEKGFPSAFHNRFINALTKYVVKTHQIVSIMNEKWPYGIYYGKNKEFLDYFKKNFKPPFSIFSTEFIKYDPFEIFLPRLKEFLMFVLAFDLDNHLSYKNILKYRDILFRSRDNLCDNHVHEKYYNDACNQLLRGVFLSFGANYDSL